MTIQMSIEVFKKIKEIVERYNTQEIFDVDLMSSEIKDFIIEDRYRICLPLMKHKIEKSKDEWQESDVNIAIDEALKIAGLDVLSPSRKVCYEKAAI